MPTYTERKEIDQVVIVPGIGRLGWREATIVERDGVEISREVHRTTIEADYEDFPGHPVIPPEVLSIINANRLFSAAVVAAARERRAAAVTPRRPTP